MTRETPERPEFLMPSLGADMESGTVAEWLVKPGDRIRKGDIIAVVDTDKALIEVESFHTGVVEKLLVGTGERVPVGTALAVIAARPPKPAKPAKPAGPGKAVEPAKLEKPVKPEKPARPEKPAQPGKPLKASRAETPPADVERPALPSEVKISPLARRLARELGVDLAEIHAGGRTGAIHADDVREAAARAGRAAPGEETGRVPPEEVATAAEAAGEAGLESRRETEEAGLESRREAARRAIARAMARSNREIPHYHLGTTVDMSAALAWLRERNRHLPVARRLLPAVLLLKAAARAAGEVPRLNGFWIDDAFVPGEAVHLGVAISLKGGGLVAPALHDAAGRDLEDLMAALKDLAGRARSGRLRDTEVTEATITVTNLGERGAETVHGVIYPPQVALVGFGGILERPWAVGGLLGVRPLVNVTLAADHRATDGYTGGRFLEAVDRLLNSPERL